jgi:predicted nucleic acid-binding protein
MQVVSDTSALVSLGVIADRSPNPLDHLLETHELLVPVRVHRELESTAAYDDQPGAGATAVLDRSDQFEERSVELDETFPLDDGENAAVRLANDLDAGQLLCDEFNRLGLVHASLTRTRLVTSPILLVLLESNGVLSTSDATASLDEMRAARSWDGNSYVERALTTLEE